MRKRIQVVVVGAIKHNGKYLLTKRYNPHNKLTHNKWQCAGGGLEFNESIIECLHRELKEETGINVKIIAQVPYIHEKILGSWHGVAICFLCEPKDKNFKVKIDHEASDYGWFSFREAINLDLHHGTKDFLEAVERLKF